ncbi:hypothetical protein PLESTF_001854300 [Pleodorina starrii]|nr:hypothetical protein PLESTM_000906200 [Pleodorina starrii]GLC76908.1 hypothetical protein PLESTF_001854300 [Pleodorina starrii]
MARFISSARPPTIALRLHETRAGSGRVRPEHPAPPPQNTPNPTATRPPRRLPHQTPPPPPPPPSPRCRSPSVSVSGCPSRVAFGGEGGRPGDPPPRGGVYVCVFVRAVYAFVGTSGPAT